MSVDDYESLPETSKFTTHMLAGAAAGIMEHCIMYPVDCIKTRMQVLAPDPRANYRNVLDALHTIVRIEGPRSTLRGIQAMVGGAGPAHAMYFACYEKLKRVFTGATKKSNPLANGFAGGVATILHDAVMNPADVIKQRMQVFNSPFTTCRECGQTILRAEGIRAFYRSYSTTLCMNVPFQCIHFVTYEWSQESLNSARCYDPKSHVVSGAVAGAVAAAVTTPLDVCKTLLNTQEKCARRNRSAIDGVRQAVSTVYEHQGARGFIRGMGARVIYQMPSTAIAWSTYEFFKYVIFEEHRRTAAK